MSVSNDKIVTIFIDTNVFIQLKDIKDLPWKTLFPKVTESRVMVCSRIIEELDQFKVGNRKRLRDRSRLALKAIKQAARSLERELCLRETPFKIILKLTDMGTLDWDAHPKLDPTKPDHHLVLEAYSYDGEAIVFSHDTGPYVQATGMGLIAADPPEDGGWHLQAEPTAEDEKIKQLGRELAQAKATSPQIAVAFEDRNSGEVTGKFTFIVPELSPLSQGLIEKLTASFLQIHPRHKIDIAQNHVMTMLSEISGQLTQRDSDRYFEKYAEFQSQVKAFFETLHERIARVSKAQAVPFYVENEGQAAAQGLRIDTTVSEPFFMFRNEEDAEKTIGSITFPEPPDRPRPRALQNLDRLNVHGLIHQGNHRRDPTGFYWEERPKLGSQRSALQCEDFRAKETYAKDAWVCALDNPPIAGVIDLKISASNMREPVTVSAEFEFVRKRVEWTDPRFHGRLPDILSELLILNIE